MNKYMGIGDMGATKTCIACTAQMPKTAKFCPNCGASAEAQTKQTKDTPKKKGGSIGWIAIIVVVGLIILAISSGSGGEGGNTNPNSNQVATNEEQLAKAISLLDAGDTEGATAAFRAIRATRISEEQKPTYHELGAKLETEIIASNIEAALDGAESTLDKIQHLKSAKYSERALTPNSDLINQLYEDAVLEIVKPLPASDIAENLAGYQLLSKIRPNANVYREKVEQYKNARTGEARRVLSRYRKSDDKFNDVSFYTHHNSPAYLNSRSTIYVFIGISKAGPWLLMRTQYASNDWLFVNEVQVHVDGETFTLTSGAFDRDNNSEIWEWRNESVSAAQRILLEKMSEGSDVTLRFIGQQYRKDVKMSSADKKALREVFTDYERVKVLFD